MTEIGDFDFEKFNEEFEASYQEEQVEEKVDEEIEEIEEVVEDEEETNPEGEGDPNLEDQPEGSEEVDPVEAKRNAAFAQLRRERDEAKRVADWLASVAEQNGTTPEQMMENYQKALLQKQAENENVPVEVLERIQKIEQENNFLKQSTFAERFEAQVLKTKADHNATEDDLDAAFKYAHDNGLTEVVQNGQMTFEALYKLAHLDTITERKIQEALQNDLSKKKKRQQEAPLPNGSSATQIDDSLEERARKDAAKYIADGSF